jgi:hypothetical protein
MPNTKVLNKVKPFLEERKTNKPPSRITPLLGTRNIYIHFPGANKSSGMRIKLGYWCN